MRNDRGMTLVEVLVSVALIAVCAVPLLQLFANGALSTNQGRFMTVATNIASATMEEYRARPWERVVSEILSPFANEVDYAREVSVTSVASDLKEVSVTVSWNRGGGDRRVQLTSYLYAKGR